MIAFRSISRRPNTEAFVFDDLDDQRSLDIVFFVVYYSCLSKGLSE
jgi:hypothetical protein